MAEGGGVGSALVDCLATAGPKAAGVVLGSLRAALDAADRERDG